MKTDKKIMFGIRIYADLHKKMKMICVERAISIQEFTGNLIEKEVKKHEDRNL